MDICIKIVAGLGVLGLILGLAGEPTILTGGCLLIGFALVAAAIRSKDAK